MNKLLPFLLIIFLFVVGCSSTQSLTNCPQFKGQKTNKHLTKTLIKKKERRNKSNLRQVEKIAKAKQKQTKKINKLSQKVIRQLEKRNVLAKLEEMPQSQTEKLYEALSKLKINQHVFKQEANLEIASTFQNKQSVQPIVQWKEIDKISDEALVDISLPKHFDRKKINIKQIQQTNFTPTRPHAFTIVSLVCGILSILLSFLTILVIPLAILAIIFGALGIRKVSSEPKIWRGKGMALAGIIMGSLMLLLAILVIVYLIAFFTW